MRQFLLLLFIFILLQLETFPQVRKYVYFNIHKSNPLTYLSYHRYQLCFFEVEDYKYLEELYIEIYGSDYDYDKDGNYTDIAILINDTVFAGPINLSKKKFGKDGELNWVTFEIKKKVFEGFNSIKIINIDDTLQNDFIYIDTLKIVEKRKEVWFMYYLKKSIIPLLILSIIIVIVIIIKQIFNNKS